jgi:Ca2+-binding EF-hand superfamily protein
MHTKIATAIVLSLAFASQPRGWVSSVTASAGASVGTYQVSVRGNNPCGAVNIDFGDGTTPVTHAISQVPVTITHEYSRVGEYTIRARGMGNCDGDVFTRVNVTRVRSSIFNRNQDQNQNRFAEMDRNGDGIITRAEWRGTVQAFNLADWNNDGRLSGDEVRAGDDRNEHTRFAGMDRNGDGVITRNEWRGNAQSFNQHDWNGDGRLSGEEVRPGARPQYEWTDTAFRRLDRNRDNYLSGNEWRYEPDDFLLVDRNSDDRISLAEFRNGDNALVNEMPGGRGRGWGRGNDQALSVIVTNREEWTDTGIDVRAGDSLDITATGRVQYSSQLAHVTGPDGTPSVTRPQAPMPNTAVGALVGRVGNSAPFFVGAKANALRVPRAGRLFLGINDDILTDNSGEFRVTISVNGRGIIR